jgi:threonine dehydratase
MRHAIEVEHMLVEGSAGVAMGALRQCEALPSGPVVIVLCGANISATRLREVL